MTIYCDQCDGRLIVGSESVRLAASEYCRCVREDWGGDGLEPGRAWTVIDGKWVNVVRGEAARAEKGGG